MERVGVRELRQNLSRYLHEVKEGETFVVTERGREVARLSPSGPADSPIAATRRLVLGEAAAIAPANLRSLTRSTWRPLSRPATTSAFSSPTTVDWRRRQDSTA